MMGVLRAIADAVVVGAGTLRVMPDHLWTAEYIFPALAHEYWRLRAGLGMPEPPLNVIVSGSGRIGADARVVRSGEVPALIVTTTHGAERLHDQPLSRSVKVATVAGDGAVSAGAILDAIARVRRSGVILVEGGPRLMGDFFAERRLDELFLTLAPQVAGRGDSVDRLGLVSGKIFAPDSPLWGTLVSIRRAGSHLFLRYQFAYSED
jgi:riboflavin biosynthesis pyrimidine reductase